MLAATPSNIKKLEDLFKEVGYVMRYEKGNFTSGYCILEDRKVVVINRYFQNEAKLNTLLDILFKITIDETLLTKESAELYLKLKGKLMPSPDLFTDEKQD
jgi:hypothetical protein